MSPDVSAAYRRYVLVVLTLLYTLNFLDRILLTLFLEPIKNELHLSDTQLGFITGIAFALFYATLGIPIARWSDRGNRVTIAAAAIALWGLTSMSYALVFTFAQLVIARVVAAVGESGCMPPTYSLIGDYYSSPRERARAMTVYYLGNSLSSLIGFLLGGWLSERHGWRHAFFIIGIPAILLALLVKLTIVEPRRRAGANHRAATLPGMTEVLGRLWKGLATRHLIVGIVLLYMVALGMAPWYSAFMMRSHGMSTAEVGLWLGLTFGLGGIAGTFLGGYAATRWFGDNERDQLRVCAITVALLTPCFVTFLLASGKHLALLALAPLTLVFCFFLGPTYAVLQRLVPDNMRATTLAVVMLLANLIGMGLGPQLIGILSDVLQPRLGTDALRHAMAAMSVMALWAAGHFWKAGATVRSDIVERENDAAGQSAVG